MYSYVDYSPEGAVEVGGVGLYLHEARAQRRAVTPQLEQLHRRLAALLTIQPRVKILWNVLKSIE